MWFETVLGPSASTLSGSEFAGFDNQTIPVPDLSNVLEMYIIDTVWFYPGVFLVGLVFLVISSLS